MPWNIRRVFFHCVCRRIKKPLITNEPKNWKFISFFSWREFWMLSGMRRMWLFGVEQNSNVWFFVCSVNGLYALYWDIVMDWGMMQNPSAVIQTACVRGIVIPEGREPASCHHAFLRPQLRFGLAMSVLILLADSLLRFSWLLRFVTRFPTNDSFVLCTQFLEVFR